LTGAFKLGDVNPLCPTEGEQISQRRTPMKSPRIAILLPAATLLLAGAPLTQAASASQGHSHVTAASRSDSSRDVNEPTNNPDRSRSDNGRSDNGRSDNGRSDPSSPDRTSNGHDAGDR
jgi:hypothetical protein